MKILPLLEDYEVEYDNEGNPLSPEQTEFFKNSKVRDDKGRLLVCYHGTYSRFNAFDIEKSSRDSKLGIGIYFTKGEKLRYQYPISVGCYINITNPVYEYTDDFSNVLSYQEQLMDNGFSNSDIVKNVSKMFKIDGVIGDDGGHKAICCFYPNQIKSIYNKNPSNSNNINEETELNEVYPNKGESKQDFISRFMSVTKDEYPDVKQRYAVANSYWDRRNKR